MPHFTLWHYSLMTCVGANGVATSAFQKIQKKITIHFSIHTVKIVVDLSPKTNYSSFNYNMHKNFHNCFSFVVVVSPVLIYCSSLTITAIR